MHGAFKETKHRTGHCSEELTSYGSTKGNGRGRGVGGLQAKVGGKNMSSRRCRLISRLPKAVWKCVSWGRWDLKGERKFALCTALFFF